MKSYHRKQRCQRGVTMVEFSLLLSLLAMALIPSTTILSDRIECVDVVAAFFAGGGSKSLDFETISSLYGYTWEQKVCLLEYLNIPYDD